MIFSVALLQSNLATRLTQSDELKEFQLKQFFQNNRNKVATYEPRGIDLLDNLRQSILAAALLTMPSQDEFKDLLLREISVIPKRSSRQELNEKFEMFKLANVDDRKTQIDHEIIEYGHARLLSSGLRRISRTVPRLVSRRNEIETAIEHISPDEIIGALVRFPNRKEENTNRPLRDLVSSLFSAQYGLYADTRLGENIAATLSEKNLREKEEKVKRINKISEKTLLEVLSLSAVIHCFERYSVPAKPIVISNCS